MSEEAPPSFRTKLGICTITPESIILTRQGMRGQLSNLLIGSKSIVKLLIAYLVIGLVFVIVGVKDLVRGEYLSGSIILSIGIYFISHSHRSRNNSAAPVINRADIRAIKATTPKPPATRGYFTIQFDQDGEPKQRLIILPGVLEDGSAEFDRALSAFEKAGLEVT